MLHSHNAALYLPQCCVLLDELQYLMIGLSALIMLVRVFTNIDSCLALWMHFNMVSCFFCIFPGSVFDVLATHNLETPSPKLPQAKISFTPASTPAQVKTEVTGIDGQTPQSTTALFSPFITGHTPEYAAMPISATPGHTPHTPTAMPSPSTTGSMSTPSTGFQPFAKAPEKQLRYEKFLELKNQGKAGEFGTVVFAITCQI